MHWSVAVFAAVLMCFFILLSTVAIQPGKFAETLKNFMAAPVLWLLNAVPVIALFGVAWAICANVFWAGALTSLVFNLLSIINLIKIEGRNDPLTAADFGLITEALQATGEYKLNLHIWLIVLTVLASALLILAGIKIKSGKWIPVRAAAGVLSVTLMAVMMAKVYPSEDLMGNINVKVERRVKGDGGKYSVYNVPAVFDNTGFIYGFFRTFNSNKIERPSGYSKSAAASWDKETATPADPAERVAADVIFIQCEAFSDFMADADCIEYGESGDPLALYREVASSPRSVAGKVVVPDFGAGTANTEFDVITGMQTKMISKMQTSSFRTVHKDVPSLARVFAGEGYEGYFMHPGSYYFYNRQSVYSHFGLDTQVFSRDFTDPDKKGGRFITDEAFGDKLIEDYEEYVASSEDPWFAFTVTIQNHQAYGSGKYGFKVEKLGFTREISSGAATNLSVYAEGIRDSSVLLKRLTEYFDGADRPVMLVFWGDHLPAMGSNFSVYREIGLKIGEENDPEAAVDTYSTPFVIWVNGAFEDSCDYKEKIAMLDLPADGRISAIYLGELAYELCGMRGTDAYFDFLGDSRRELPVISHGRYVLPDGTVTETLTEKQQAVIDKLDKWEYYRLVDQKVK